MARRNVSSKASGEIAKGPAPDGSVTIVGVVSPSTRGRATFVSTGVTRPPERRELRCEQRDRNLQARAHAQGDRHPVEHLPVGEHVRAADLHLPPLRRGEVGSPPEVLDHVIDADLAG